MSQSRQPANPPMPRTRQPDTVNLEVKSARRPRANRGELPIYEHRRFRCPECDGLAFKMRSKKDPDGVATQDRRCLDCGFRFYLIVE